MRHQGYCRAAACDRYGTIWARGYCARCFMYWRRHGVERPAALNLRGQPKRCRLPDCPRREVYLERGLCHKHYLRWWRRFGGANNRRDRVAS